MLLAFVLALLIEERTLCSTINESPSTSTA
jgi:hypothetical protein